MQSQIESRTSPTSRRQIIHSHRAFSSPLLENLKLNIEKTTNTKQQTSGDVFFAAEGEKKKVLLLWKLNINCQSDSKEFHQVARRDFSCSWMNKGTGGLFSQSSTFPCDNKESKVHYKERIWAAAWWNMISGLDGYCAWGWTWRLAYSIQHRSHHRFFFSFCFLSRACEPCEAVTLHLFINLHVFRYLHCHSSKKREGDNMKSRRKMKKDD